MILHKRHKAADLWNQVIHAYFGGKEEYTGGIKI
jgi:hypothetical protein